MPRPTLDQGILTPARGGERGNPPVDARRVDRDGGAEAVADQADARGIDLRPARQERQRVLRILDLLQTDDAPARALALAAAAKVEPQRGVAQTGQQLRHRDGDAAVLVAAEAVQDEKARPALAGGRPVCRVHDA